MKNLISILMRPFLHTNNCLLSYDSLYFITHPCFVASSYFVLVWFTPTISGHLQYFLPQLFPLPPTILSLILCFCLCDFPDKPFVCMAYAGLFQFNNHELIQNSLENILECVCCNHYLLQQIFIPSVMT